jgi:quercetin dioxygenase-like cupin family protein
VEGEVYTLRLKMPADYFIAPHTHPLPERAVVLSGTMYLGHDTEMNKESAERIETGTYLTIPPEMVHYVISGSKGETILHITSVGPLELNYVNEEDDPRLR